MFQIGIVLLIVVGIFLICEWTGTRLSESCYKHFVWFIFAVYSLGNLYFTLLSRTPGSGASLTLLPLQSYVRLGESTPNGAEKVGGFVATFLHGTTPLTGIILNVLLYVPLGYLLPLLFPKLKARQVIMVSLLCSVATEAVQYLFKMGWCETDDVIHNTLGATIGLWIWRMQHKKE